MKTMFSALASVSLIAALSSPLPASAQSRGGGFHGGGVRGGGSFHGGGGRGGQAFHGGGFRGGGFRGGIAVSPRGFRGGGVRTFRSYRSPDVAGAAALGFALGAGLAYPWSYGELGYYDYPGGYLPAAPPVVYADPWAYDYGTSQACGVWAWDPAGRVYNWVPC